MICGRCGQEIGGPLEESFAVEGMRIVAEYSQPLPQDFLPPVCGSIFCHTTEAGCIAALRDRNERLEKTIEWVIKKAEDEGLICPRCLTDEDRDNFVEELKNKAGL